MDLEGNVIEGNKKPSSDHDMHSIVYRNRSDANAMVHTHALYATTISWLNMDLPAVDYLVAHSGGKNVRCADYATFGTRELAENAIKSMRSEEHTSELQSRFDLVCRLLLEEKNHPFTLYRDL